jgi:hypothetical protein
LGMAWWLGRKVSGGRANRPSPQSPKGILGSSSPVVSEYARHTPLLSAAISPR